MDEPACPRCGLEKDRWKGNRGQGVEREGLTYCCEGCAGGDICTCL